MVVQAPPIGEVEVTVVTTGATPDPDGYTVTVDHSQNRSVAINASVTFKDLPTGEHEVELSGVTANCAVASPNPQTVTVPAGGTASTAFAVRCVLVLSDKIVIQNGNYGGDIYVMNSDGSDLVNLTNSPLIEHQPAVSPDGTRIAFVGRTGGGNLWSSESEVYVMGADGSNPTRLTNDNVVDVVPTWSPNGAKIAFMTRRDSDGDSQIYVMNANGLNPFRLTGPGMVPKRPDWSR
jgi:hypothetical protein